MPYFLTDMRHSIFKSTLWLPVAKLTTPWTWICRSCPWLWFPWPVSLSVGKLWLYMGWSCSVSVWRCRSSSETRLLRFSKTQFLLIHCSSSFAVGYYIAPPTCPWWDGVWESAANPYLDPGPFHFCSASLEAASMYCSDLGSLSRTICLISSLIPWWENCRFPFLSCPILKTLCLHEQCTHPQTHAKLAA